MRRLLVLLIMTAGVGTALFAQNAEEIIRRLERNQTHETSRAEGRMVIRDRFGERTSTFITWTEGTEYTLIEFTSPGETGQKVLRTQDELYLFYPDAAELIRLQGAALRESMLGSDVSYEDMTGNRGLLDTYAVELAGEETVDGNRTWILDLQAKTRDVAYPRQKYWIDAELYVLRKAEQYALSGRLLKTMEVTELMEQQGKVFPSRMIIRDQLKRSSSTEFAIDTIRIDLALPRGIFSLEELTW